MAAHALASENIGPGAVHAAGLVGPMEVDEKVEVGGVFRGLEVPIGNRAAGRRRKIDLYPDYTGFDRLAEELFTHHRVTHETAVHPYPDFDVFCLCIRNIRGDRGP